MIYLTVIAGLELLVIAALVAVLVIRERDHARHLAGLMEAATAERHTLLSRIQRPEMVPPPPVFKPAATPDPRPPADIAELAKVGRVAQRRPDSAA